MNRIKVICDKLLAFRKGSTMTEASVTAACNVVVSRDLKKTSESTVKIGTHNGKFHCDEALACYMLKLVHKEVQVVRTRDEKLLDRCDILVDVGHIYDHNVRKYDHHQRTFEHTLRTLGNYPFDIRLSSAGLVYFHYGKDVIRHLLYPAELTEDRVEFVFKKTYANFLHEIDGIDNGIPTNAVYPINTHIGRRVDRFNKEWNQRYAEHDEEEQFRKAMELVGSEFSDEIRYVDRVLYPARRLVVEAMEKRFDIHESGVIIELEKYCPWQEHLYELEAEMEVKEPILFVIFYSGQLYRVQAVPETLNSFVCRLFLHPRWMGLRDEELCMATNIKNAVFVHSSGFIGGNKTKEGALEMALKTLDHARQQDCQILQSSS